MEAKYPSILYNLPFHKSLLMQAIVTGRSEIITKNTTPPNSSAILNKNGSNEKDLEGLHRLADGMLLVAAPQPLPQLLQCPVVWMVTKGFPSS